ncbi:MAG TPA: hypothetical protein VKF14_19335 [Candidatus Dormibacteraeota bacterium]|nr:hypothetical protein [Candidatus Dormibacteraeota bacterium]
MTDNRGRTFTPLDPDERLPRESLREGRRGLQLYRVDVDHRRLSRRELAGVLSLPALFLLLALLGWAKADTALAVGAVLSLMLGLVVFAFSGRRGSDESTTGP